MSRSSKQQRAQTEEAVQSHAGEMGKARRLYAATAARRHGGQC